MNFKEFNLFNLTATETFAKKLSQTLKMAAYPQIIFLNGDLGSGKTTLVQLLLKDFGIVERVKSPTYTLIETYQFKDLSIYHLDLYRITDVSELEHLGLRDLYTKSAIFLIEWPQILSNIGIIPTLTLSLSLLGESARKIEISSTQVFWKDQFNAFRN